MGRWKNLVSGILGYFRDLAVMAKQSILVIKTR